MDFTVNLWACFADSLGQFAYALQLISVSDGMYAQGWRWIYIIEGLLTIVAAVACLFTVPQCK